MKLRTRIAATISLAVTCIVAGVGVVLFAAAHESLRAQPRLAELLAYCGLGVIVVGSLAGWVLASRLARPLERWVAAADRIGVGDLHVEFPAADGSYEARRLSAALKSMTQRLAEKEDALQARIDERTSQLVEATRALEAQRERLAYALEGSRLALFDLDARTGRVLLSEEWARMVGAPEGETVTTAAALAERVPVEEHATLYESVIAILKGERKQYDVEHRYRREDGSILWIRSRGHVTERDANGRALRATGTNADITARKTVEQLLQHQALTDPLTDLPNSRHFSDRLAKSVARARREDGVLALLYADLDGFKAVNDARGHAAGDELLRQIGKRFVESVRASDIVARVGGDEFAVLLDTAASPEGAGEVAGKLHHALQAPFALADGAEARLTCSIGIALFPADGADAPALLGAADGAMYRAKAGGKGMHAWAGHPGDGAPGSIA
jgi:diguanylate cyclase (GGDEF)-like protein/PAS domain S-box-containing protein